jgi:hypothetical protein
MSRLTGSHLASCSVDTGVLFLEMRWLGLETDHQSPSSAEVKYEWSYISVTAYTFMSCKMTTLPVLLHLLIYTVYGYIKFSICNDYVLCIAVVRIVECRRLLWVRNAYRILIRKPHDQVFFWYHFQDVFPSLP